MAENSPDLERAAASARRAAQLALVCVAVAVLVLLIDNSIKRHIVAKAGEARAILDEFNVRAGQVINGQVQANVAGDNGVPADPGGEPGERVGDPAGGSEDVAEAAVGGQFPPRAGGAGGAGGPRGDGG